jgi:glyoxylase I family protein
MSVAITTTGIHRLVLRSSDLARSRRFYIEMLGFPLALEGPNIFLFLVGDTAVEVRGPEPLTTGQEAFNPFRAGLDRIALACTDEQELARVVTALSHAALAHTGIRTDPALDRKYVAFEDPDRIGWELGCAHSQR